MAMYARGSEMFKKSNGKYVSEVLLNDYYTGEKSNRTTVTKGDGMQETDLVIELIEELSNRQCNGHAKVRLGTALADPDKFKNIFSHYSRGTYFEQVDLELEEIYPVIQCSCGYTATVTSPDMLSAPCPKCGGEPQLEHGTEFEIVEPEA